MAKEIRRDLEYQSDTSLEVKVSNKVAKKKKKGQFKRYFPFFIMLSPGLLYLIINNYLPMFGLVIAFKEFNFAQGIFGSEWIGLKNFEFLFKTQDAFIITRNTILYNGSFIILNTVTAIGVAVLLNEVRKVFFVRLYQSIILIPFLISMVVASYLAYAALSVESGILNNTILPMFGLDPISWYTEPKYWPFILPIINLWKSIGFFTIIFFSAVIGIDKQYYEAATLDGASKFQQVIKITIPLIAPVIVMMTLLSIGRIFYSDFGLFYQVPLNSGMLYDTTNVIDTYVYRGLLELGDIGMASAAGFYQSIVGFVLVLLANLIVRKFSKDNALF